MRRTAARPRRPESARPESARGGDVPPQGGLRGSQNPAPSPSPRGVAFGPSWKLPLLPPRSSRLATAPWRLPAPCAPPAPHAAAPGSAPRPSARAAAHGHNPEAPGQEPNTLMPPPAPGATVLAEATTGVGVCSPLHWRDQAARPPVASALSMASVHPAPRPPPRSLLWL